MSRPRPRSQKRPPPAGRPGRSRRAASRSPRYRKHPHHRSLGAGHDACDRRRAAVALLHRCVPATVNVSGEVHSRPVTRDDLILEFRLNA